MAAKNVFISHVHEDDELVQKLKDLVGPEGYRDGSIGSSKPNEATNDEYIKSEILAPRIRWAGTMIVMVSPQTHESKWVEWEIEYAHKEGKRIVGLWVQGGQDSDIPRGLDDYADAFVGWQAQRVMDAITGKINNWYGPDGQERPRRKIAHYSCQ